MEPSITLTRHDVERLEQLIRTRQANGARQRLLGQLESELRRARVVAPEDVPGNVITMNSTVVFFDEQGQRWQFDLVYPEEAGPGRLSVLSPMGVALLGLTVGDTIDWPLPDGTTYTFQVVDIIYQPERAGVYHL